MTGLIKGKNSVEISKAEWKYVVYGQRRPSRHPQNGLFRKSLFVAVIVENMVARFDGWAEGIAVNQVLEEETCRARYREFPHSSFPTAWMRSLGAMYMI